MNFKKVFVSFASILVMLNISCCSSVYYAGCGSESRNTVDRVSLPHDKHDAMVRVAKQFDLDCQNLEPILSFEVSQKDEPTLSCSLVFLYDCKEHRECFLRLFSKARPEYMKYYMGGKLLSEDATNKRFDRSLSRMYHEGFVSITFIIYVDGEPVGRIGIGPFDENAEIGYILEEEVSGKGIMKASVGKAMEFVKMISPKLTTEKIRATAHPDNAASNRILQKNGFECVRDFVSDEYDGPRKEYFYYFKK